MGLEHLPSAVGHGTKQHTDGNGMAGIARFQRLAALGMERLSRHQINHRGIQQTMAKTIDFSIERLKKMGKTGEANFICCPECHGEEWAVACMSNGYSPFIFALVCKPCGADVVLTVEDGIIDKQPAVV